MPGGDLHQLAVPDLLAEEDRLLSELLAVRAEVRRRLLGGSPPGDVAALVRAVVQELRPPPTEDLIDLERLARKLGTTPKALRGRLERPSWAWLRALGDRHRDGRGRRWLWSEVEAARAERRRAS